MSRHGQPVTHLQLSRGVTEDAERVEAVKGRGEVEQLTGEQTDYQADETATGGGTPQRREQQVDNEANQQGRHGDEDGDE